MTFSPDGPNPARLYGLPKIHKPLVNGLPKYRPIISQIGSATYKIAKFLLDYVQPHTTNQYTIKDTFYFVSILDFQQMSMLTWKFEQQRTPHRTNIHTCHGQAYKYVISSYNSGVSSYMPRYIIQVCSN